MSKPVLSLALCSALIAAAMIWVGFDRLDNRSGPSSDAVESIDSRTGLPSNEESPDDSPSPYAPAPKPSQQAEAPGEAQRDALDPANENATIEPPPIELAAKIDNLLPQREDGTDAGADAKDEPVALAKSARVVCEFSQGSDNAAADGQLRSASASWQGGPITYDSIDFDAGTAQMTGSIGATGSVEGHADARVIVRGARIDFFVSLPSGGLVLTTVFGESRVNDRYVAVMSRHEGPRSQGVGTYGAQFLGFCR